MHKTSAVNLDHNKITTNNKSTTATIIHLHPSLIKCMLTFKGLCQKFQSILKT